MNQQISPYAIKEAALIFESGSNKLLDYVIGVKAPLEMRLQRAINRDGLSKDDALARINKQMNEDEKMGKCDFVITNNELEMLIPQVLDLHKKLLRTAGTV
jgi:dephospho-CoA kinase